MRISNLLILLCAVLPVATLTSFSLPSITFYALLLASLALVLLPAARGGAAPETSLACYRRYFLVCSMPFLAILVATAVHGRWPGTESESALRFSLAMPLMMAAMARVAPQRLQWALAGAGAALIAGLAYTLQYSWPDFQRATTQVIIPVSYGSILMLLVAIVLFALKLPLTRWPRLEAAAKILLAVIGLAAAQLTQSRTSWLAVPVFILLGLLLFVRGRNALRLVAVGAACAAVAGVLLFSSSGLRASIDRGVEETRTCFNNPDPIDNSVCIRFQLWRAAWDIFQANPVAGTGDGGKFRQIMQDELVEAGVVSSFTAQNFGEPHNDMLHKLMSLGVVGGLGLLVVYFAPAWIFLRRLLTATSDPIRAAAAMGAAVCLGFACFGLTEMMFRNMRIVGLYSMLVALFMVLSHDGKGFLARK